MKISKLSVIDWVLSGDEVFEDRFKDLSLLSSLQLCGTTRNRQTDRTRKRIKQGVPVLSGRTEIIHTIFEGTSEIQQLVISRAISGLRIE